VIPTRPRRDNREHAIARVYVGQRLGSYEFDVARTSAKVELHNYRVSASRPWSALNRSINQLRIALYLHQLLKAEAANVTA
jgi:hypothetical protein